MHRATMGDRPSDGWPCSGPFWDEPVRHAMRQFSGRYFLAAGPVAAAIYRLAVWSIIAGLTAWVGAGSRPVPSLLADTGVRLVQATVDGARAELGLNLDIYLPPADPAVQGGPIAHPAVLAIHGGSWVGGSRMLYRFAPQDTVIRLAERGVVVFAVDYSLARPGSPTYPAALEELRDTVRWIRRHAREFHVDPSRVAALGQSAGAQLALLLGTTPDEVGPDGMSSRVQAVISFYAPADLIRLVDQRSLRHEPVRRLIGAQASSTREVLARASPITHVTPDDAPALLIHGSADRWVFPDQSTQMAEALERAGVRQRMILVEGARHGFEATVRAPERRDLMPEIFAFLQSVWNVR
jgi:acetyl esterase/lipase